MNNLKQLGIAGLTALSLLSSPLVQAEKLQLKLDKAAVVSAMNTALMGTEINFDNYGSRHGNSWHTNNSYIRMPNGKQYNFNIKEHSVTVKGAITKKVWRRYKAYVNDIASSSVSVKPEGNALKLRVDFESAGSEALVRCLNGKNHVCKIEPLKKTVQLNNLTTSAVLKPVKFENSISFAKNPKVAVNFDLKFDSKLLNAASAIANKYTGYKSQLKELAAQKMQTALNQYRSTVATKLKKLINDKAANAVAKIPGVGNQAQQILKNLKVTKVSTSGNKYLVEVSFPDPIGKHSLAIKSLKPTYKNQTMQCPANVDFKATIHTQYALKGQVWLENEDGSKTKKINWNNGKNQTTSSIINRSWKAQGYNKKNGWSKMVITYKDQQGKSYTKKSNKVQFSLTCSKTPTNIKMGPKTAKSAHTIKL